jgi:hypothetical protein
MSKKMTIAETFAEIIDTYDLTDAHKAFLLDRIEKATRKTDGEKKLTAKQIQNAAVADEVYAFMADTPDTAYTVSELLKVCPSFTAIDGCSASYANAIVKKLKDAGRVARAEVKGRAYFTAVVE